ncbi:hypothetical protein ACOSQ4_016104 [Xanthoceras sorbifolium]
MASPNDDQKSNGALTRGCQWFKALSVMSWVKIVVKAAEKSKQIANDDPRRIVHSLKVGLALIVVSMFYYFKQLFDNFGDNTMWAVLTVVVVFEFSVGATFKKGLNRMIATLTGGALGAGAHLLATLSGSTGEPILISFFVFITAGIVTFMKFFPSLKARFDYGFTIFILTFCLISVSGTRDSQALQMAQDRLSTIIIGSCTAILICIFICPVWSGEDLHNLVAGNIEKLGNFLEGFGVEYFQVIEDDDQKRNEDKSFLEGYKSVLNSKSNEENMASLATWEPSHGGFRFRHPWKQYQKIGTLTRQCAYRIEALSCYIDSEIQSSLEIRSITQETCTKISTESGKALKELAIATKKMTRSKSANPHIANSKTAVEKLKSELKIRLREEEALLLDTIQVGAVASLLVEVVECTEKIAEAVYELAAVAEFKRVEATVSPEQPHLLHQRGVVQPHHVITVVE